MTPRQKQIALLVAAGSTNVEVAKHLVISTHTVNTTCAECSTGWESPPGASCAPGWPATTRPAISHRAAA
ncbi:LuxR C-terminal-related transcriptional regulator [Asanoa sp. NPDC049518]|uniref:LuxR C-terminal-related transcriptional regulator n=1 Tax=unclassified Asanoa TaxID=2685164 RepID=UPI0034291ECD